MVKKCGGRCNLFEMPEMHTSLIHVRLVKIIKSIISNFKQSLVNPVWTCMACVISKDEKIIKLHGRYINSVKGSRYCNINIKCHAIFYSINIHLKF